MSEEKNFGYLGHKFQSKLISQVLFDEKFASNIVPILESGYFDDQYFRLIMQFIKEFHERYETIPSYDALTNVAKIEVTTKVAQKYILDILEEVKNEDLKDFQFVQDKAFKFCKQQILKRAIQKSQKLLDKGEFEKYDEIEEYIKEALMYGNDTDDIVDVFSNLELVLVDNYRDTYPTGIDGLDVLLKGGIAKGEMMIVLAPMGTGKSTALSYIANSTFNFGATVLQIFFEDNIDEIKRKHICKWTGIDLESLGEDTLKDPQAMTNIENAKKNGGKLLLKRWASDTKTMTDIKNYIRKLNSDGIKIDMVVIDYLECVLPDKGTDDVYSDEGKTTRKFESMCHELGLAGVTATQGNRQSINADVVTNEQMGGSIKKAQIGHIVISIAKNLMQKENGLATMALLKSRVGKDGIVFENCIFNNMKMEISTEQAQTFLGFEEDRTQRNVETAREAYRERRTRRESANNG